MKTYGIILTLILALPGLQSAAQRNILIRECDFSKLTPGKFGEFSAKGFPEYHFVPRKFTDGWDIVNNRGPDEWKVLESEGKQSLFFLGYNSAEWTHDFTYPIICSGDSLWKDYTLEVQLTPLDRNDLNGIIFRYRDGRHYYLFGLDKNGRATLRYRDGEKDVRQDGWHEIASAIFQTDSTKKYTLSAELKGGSIRCLIDGKTVISAEDKRYSGGKIGLLANSPVAFHKVLVKVSRQEYEDIMKQDSAVREETGKLMSENPKPLLWKRISTHGAGVARAMRLGDLNGDGKLDFLLIQNVPFFGSNYNEISCLTAIDNDGRLLWQSGIPDQDNAWVSYDVAAQIHDLDCDGRNEVIYAQGPWIKILEGSTGKEKERHQVPSSAILPGEKSWLEYKHYYRRDLLPYLNVDCISFADLRGSGRKTDIIIKDRHTRLWAYDNKFNLLWTATANLGHFPTFFDSDKDGRDEVYIGYSKFSPDGSLLWSLDSLMQEHSDGICAGDFSLTGAPEKIFVGGSDDGVLFLDGSGNILRRDHVGHAQTPSAGQFRPDIPGLEFCNINYWGEPGMITLYDCGGKKITSFELIHAGSPVMPVNWKGDGSELIFLSPNPALGGLLDGWGRRVVLFPDDGHPDLAWMAQDMTGDPRDELIVWDTGMIYIYTQDRPFTGTRIYAPSRPPLFNESNYGPVVSWPAWK